MAAQTLSTSSASGVVGSTTPRVWTRPLVDGPPGPCGCGCALTPETSYGFDVETFAADVLGLPLDPWQRWVAIHGGELLEDGRPRFTKLLVIVARQNGKTHLLVVLSLFWLFVEAVAMVLGTSTKLDYAKESWLKAVAIIRATPRLRRLMPANRNQGIRQANGEQELCTVEGARYKIAPANAEGGRSLTVHRAILDELRQHHDYSAWDAIVPAMNAVPHRQVWSISNQGDDRSIVLIEEQRDAELFITTGEGDYRRGLFEYSAPPGSDPTDAHALAQANPNLGLRIDPDALVADGASAMRAGGEKLAGFLTEIMCIRVRNLDPAVDPTAWAGCRLPGDLDAVRTRLALVVDASLDGQHVALLAAAQQDDGLVRVETVDAWDGPDATTAALGPVRDYVRRIRPRVFGWLPGGPGAAFAALLKDRQLGAGARSWPPRGVRVEEIRGEVPAICMGFASLVAARGLVHSAGTDEGLDELLDAHVLAAEKLWTGDVWRFTRRGAGHVNAAYAAAGAVHLARALPKPAGPTGIVLPTGVSS